MLKTNTPKTQYTIFCYMQYITLYKNVNTSGFHLFLFSLMQHSLNKKTYYTKILHQTR